MTKSFQTPPSNRNKGHSETSGDEETDHHATSLPAQRVTQSDKIVADPKSTTSEPINLAGKKTDGSVSYHFRNIHIQTSTIYHSLTITFDFL